MEKTLRKYFPLFALPALICFALAFLIPFVWGFVLSFCEFQIITEPTFVGIDNYVRAFTVDNYFTQAFWFTLEGFFWFPRTLLGIEPHLYAFYDRPELLHRMNQDQVDFSLRLLERLFRRYRPEFMTFAEDLSYNHGPMLSRELFDEFLVPCYRQLIPVLHEHGVKVFVDSDGDVSECLGWFRDAGFIRIGSRFR